MIIGPERQIAGRREPLGLLPPHKPSSREIEKLTHSLYEEISQVRSTKSPEALQRALNIVRQLLDLNFLPQIIDRRSVGAHNKSFTKEWTGEVPDFRERKTSSDDWLKYQDIVRSFEQLDTASQKQLLRDLRIARKERLNGGEKRLPRRVDV